MSLSLYMQGCSGAVVEHLAHNLKGGGSRDPVLNYFSVTPPEISGGAENSTENSGPHGKSFFCSMYEMSQRHPVWVTENHVKPCNSVLPVCLLPFCLFFLSSQPALYLSLPLLPILPV
jgi:hypothetical protein